MPMFQSGGVHQSIGEMEAMSFKKDMREVSDMASIFRAVQPSVDVRVREEGGVINLQTVLRECRKYKEERGCVLVF